MFEFLKIENVSYSYPKSSKNAIDKVNFTVRKGEIIGVIGPNGSGKTTLMKSILNMIDYKGNIKFYDQEIKKISRRSLSKKIGVVAQEFAPIYDMKVSEIVEMGRTPYTNLFGDLSQEDKKHIEFAFEDLNIHHLKDRTFYSLSGGERQIVYVAKVFAQNPDLFLLDEATVHLDIGNAQHLLLKMKERVKKFGSTVISTFHDINQASAFSDRIIIMKSGKIYAMGDPEMVLTKDMIEEVYGANCEVIKDPRNGTVNVFMDLEDNSDAFFCDVLKKYS
ncbi:MAG: ABC transporter ATP-binding protein [Thermotogae bacterium]|jgi:iron complex transport system ATP-binding protein|nr:ABC transporter ATP-binding protein [Thermotogota bacterium]